MLIGQVSIIGHNAVQCFAFYVIVSALNKTISYNRVEDDNYREIQCADWADATTEIWKSSAVMSGCCFSAPGEVWSWEHLRCTEWYFDPLMRLCGPGGLGSDELAGATDSAARWTPSLCLLSQITSHNVTFPGFSQTSSLIRFLVCCCCSCSC